MKRRVQAPRRQPPIVRWRAKQLPPDLGELERACDERLGQSTGTAAHKNGGRFRGVALAPPLTRAVAHHEQRVLERHQCYEWRRAAPQREVAASFEHSDRGLHGCSSNILLPHQNRI